MYVLCTIITIHLNAQFTVSCSHNRKTNMRYHGMEDSDEQEESGDDSSAFFKQKPKRKNNRTSYKYVFLKLTKIKVELSL